MNVKVQCECGAKFAFEVEPLNGRMPVPIQCPSCGADATALANAVIQQQSGATSPALGSAPAAPEPPPSGQPRLHIHKSAPAETSSVGGNALPRAQAGREVGPASVGGEDETEYCAKHIKIPAVEHCRVCKKPICPKCMEMFGYVCSVYCRNEAERLRISLPVYKFQRTVVEQNLWRRVRWVFLSVMAVAVVCAGVWAWYEFVGSRPHVVYSETFSKGDSVRLYRLLPPHNVLALGGGKLTLLNAADQKPIWSTPLTAGDSSGDSDNAPAIVLTTADIWVLLPDRIAQFDRATGKPKESISLNSPVLSVSHSDSAIVAVSSDGSGGELLTRIALPAGTVETNVIESPAGGQTTAARPQNVAAISSKSPAASFAENAAPGSVSRAFFPEANGALEMVTVLVERRFVKREAMKAKTKSYLNSELTASQSMQAAQEELNDARRENSGDTIRDDVSRYHVTLLRFPTNGAPEWSGEIIGPPAFYALKSVNVLLGGSSLLVLDKSGKKLWDAKMTYPFHDTDPEDADEKKPITTPCVESGNTLYVFDQGMLTSFGLKSGNVNWRLTSVGITGVKVDDAGKLYVTTTSASADLLQFARQINLFKKTVPVILKVEPSTGKVLWRLENMANQCYLSGKFVYASFSSTDPMAALNPSEPAATYYHFHRLDPKTGEPMWDYYQPEWAQHCEVQGNWILLQFPDKVVVLKFLSL